jgi:uncharacterized protein YfbU (UPF0304 family)
MKLSRVERLLLLNQYAMMADLIDADSARLILTHGFEREYENLPNAEQILSEACETLSVERCQEVFDVLDMYCFWLQQCWRKLGGEETGISKDAIVFPGFGGNPERAELEYARFLRNRKEFEELEAEQPNLYNSTAQLPWYRKMLAVWRDRKRNQFPLTASDIRSILDAPNA